MGKVLGGVCKVVGVYGDVLTSKDPDTRGVVVVSPGESEEDEEKRVIADGKGVLRSDM